MWFTVHEESMYMFNSRIRISPTYFSSFNFWQSHKVLISLEFHILVLPLRCLWQAHAWHGLKLGNAAKTVVSWYNFFKAFTSKTCCLMKWWSNEFFRNGSRTSSSRWGRWIISLRRKSLTSSWIQRRPLCPFQLNSPLP